MAYKGTGLYPADYDNDGDYDLLVGGSIIADPDTPTSAVLHENVNGDFQPILALPAYYHPTQEPWLDINHDGYLDLMIGNREDTTRSEPQIFINDKGNGFNEDPDFFAFFPNRRSVSMEMNNILFDGYTSMRISPATNPDDRLTLYSLSVGYRNNDSIAISSGISSSAIGFSFYNEMNNEEDMDRLVMTNSYLSTNFSQLVRFNAADYHPHIDMADINNDDYNDLVISNIEENGVPVVKIFKFAPDSLENGLYTFREVLSIPNAGLNGFAKFLDFDNDGDYDLIVDGENGSGTFLKKIYLNENGIFNFHRCFPGNTNTTMAFFDIDSDDDTDYVQIGARPGENGLKAVSEKYINSSSNQPPEPPVINSIEFNECYDKMVVHWDGPGDPDGPDEAITYDIKVGTSPGKGDIVTFQEKPGRGRLAETTQWTIHRIQPNTTYYVSVRSIDIHGIASASTETVVTSPPADNTFSFSQSYRHPESNYEIPRHFNFYDFAGDPTLDLIGLITSKDITAVHHRSDILFDAAGFNDTINSTNKYMVEHISRYYSNRLENIFGYTTVKDFNYDGLLDIKTLSNETYPARDIIHQNNGDGSFTKIDLEGRVNANSPREILYPFDMDNDGDLDMFNGTEIYENTGSSYSLVSEFPVSENDELIILNTFDYNNDGLQDLLTYVFDSTNHFDINAEASIDIYRNEGNLSFSKAATLEQNPIGYFMDYEINDMNNDGYPDILLSMNSGIGITNTVEYNLNLYTSLHESNYDKHTILEKTPTHLKTTTGDIDQDGWTDIVMFNSKSNYLSSSMVTFYRNMGGNNFEETWCSDQGYFLRQPGGYVFDHNNNGRMDIVAFFYRNRDDYMNYNINSIGLHEFNPGNVNTDPSYPVGIQSYYNDTTGYLYLTWNRGRDSETTSNAMSYAIKVGDTPGIYNLKTAAAHHSGLRKNLQQGNLNNSNVFRFKADPMDTLYYAIQSIDQGYKGSPFTGEQMIVAQQGNNTISGNILTNTAGNKGKIIIKNEGHELPGTMVYLVDSASGSYIRSATADKDGNFNFLRVPDGSYRLEILFGDLQMSDEIPFIDVDNSESISVEVTVENDGISYTYDKSDVSTDIDQPEGISAIRFYPNPASGWINIHMERADETGKKILVKAFNQTGMEIYSSLMSNTLHTVNISGWNPGIYLFHIYSKKGLVIRAEKMIVY
jgi:hypothetical protein